MLKIRFIVIGHTKSSFLKEGELFFLNRIRKYCQTEWLEIKPVPMKKGRPEAEVLRLEGQGVISKVKNSDYMVALDRKGRQYDSEGLAHWMERLSISESGWVNFLIGGPLGLSQQVLSQADRTLSLSKLTFTHEMSRLFLLEQIYRAFNIIAGTKYHK